MATSRAELRERAAGIIATAEAHESEGRPYLAKQMREDARIMTDAADQLSRGYTGDIPDSLVTAILQEVNPRVLDASRWYHEHERAISLSIASSPILSTLESVAVRALLPEVLP